MTDTAPERWVLQHQGRRLEVEGPPSRTTRPLRLFVDGEQVAEERVKGARTTRLTHDGLAVRAAQAARAQPARDEDKTGEKPAGRTEASSAEKRE